MTQKTMAQETTQRQTRARTYHLNESLVPVARRTTKRRNQSNNKALELPKNNNNNNNKKRSPAMLGIFQSQQPKLKKKRFQSPTPIQQQQEKRCFRNTTPERPTLRHDYHATLPNTTPLVRPIRNNDDSSIIPTMISIPTGSLEGLVISPVVSSRPVRWNTVQPARLTYPGAEVSDVEEMTREMFAAQLCIGGNTKKGR